MKYQTIVSLGGAYANRVSNPPTISLQTSRSVGGGVSNGCKSNERDVKERKFRAYCNLRNTISIRHFDIQSTVCSCGGNKYRQLYVPNIFNQIGRNSNLSLYNALEHWRNTSVSRTSHYVNGYKFSNRENFSWLSVFTTIRFTRCNKSDCVRLNSESGVVA